MENNQSQNSELCAALKELISKNTEGYLQFWHYSQKKAINVEKLEGLTQKLHEDLHRIRHLWATLKDSESEYIPIDIKITYVRYLIEISPYRDEGLLLLKEYNTEFQEKLSHDQFQKLQVCKSINFEGDEEQQGNFKIDVEETKKEIRERSMDSEEPQSMKVLRIIGISFLIAIICMNSLEWHLAADNFSDHLYNLRKISLTNQLRTESQSIVSYAQDLALLSYQEINGQIKKESNEYQEEQKQCNTGLNESIENSQRIIQQLSTKYSDDKWFSFQKQMIQEYSGVNLNTFSQQPLQNIMNNVFDISSDLFKASTDGMLASFFSYYKNSQSEDISDQNKTKMQYVVLNLLNDVHAKQTELHSSLVSDFSEETSSMADTNGIMFIFVFFILAQIIGAFIYLIVRITHHRIKIFRAMLKFPLQYQQAQQNKCRDLLLECMGKTQSDLKTNKNTIGYKEFVEDETEEIQEKPVDEGLFHSSEGESSSEDPKKLNNQINIKMIVFSAILVLLLIIYFISNYLVQKYLASDMQTYVEVENASSMSESFYMITDNALRVNLLNSTIPVLHNSSYQVFKENVLSMEDKEKEIVHFKSEIYSHSLKKTFESIMLKNPCQLIADGSDKVTTKEQCEEFGDGIVKEGLSKAMESFIQLSTEILNIIDENQKNQQDSNVKIDIITLPKIQLAGDLQRVYIKEGLLVLKDKLRTSMEKEMNYFLHWKEYSWYGGLIIIVITYLQLHFKIIRQLPLDIIKARKSLEIIPINKVD